MLTEEQVEQIELKLAAMSLRQKIGQMTMPERMHIVAEDVKHFGFGSVLSGGGSHPGDNHPDDWRRMNDEYWQAAMADGDSPGIPILFAVDAVHGHNNVKGATIFPHNIAFGAARDSSLVEAMGRVTAKEILASGLEWNFAPTLAVAQNCQWGRTYESFGNDYELIGDFGAAYVRGLQASGVMGCAKHWVGDGGTQHGIDQGETTLAWQEFKDVHVSPYLPALAEGVMSVMVSFNSWNGQKCHGHRFLITDYLKGELQFDGIVVSDWDGIDYLHENYDVAIAESVNAGIDIFMVPEKWRDFIDGAERQVENGNIPMARIDDAVTRILRTKMAFGLFDLPRPAERQDNAAADFGSEAHRAVAREVVRKSLVLLKNDDLLPLSGEERVLVAGKNANNLGHQCGGWTLSWQGERDNSEIQGTTIFEGIRSVVPGAQLSEQGGAEANSDLHDVAIVVIGETPYAEGFGDIRPGDHLLIEAGSTVTGLMNPVEPYARTLELAEIHPDDIACIERIRAAGIPVVTVLISGRPLVVNRELAASTAFVAAWLPGTEGLGVAEVLFGHHDFEGTLPLPWPARDCQPGEARYDVLFQRGEGITRLSGHSSPDIDNVVSMNYKG